MDDLRQIYEAIARLNDEPDAFDDDLDAVADRLADGKRLTTPDDGAERESLYAQFREAAAADPAALTALLASLAPGPEMALPEVYDALTPAVARWRDVFAAEHARMLALYRQPGDLDAVGGRVWVELALEGLIAPVEADDRLWTAILAQLTPLTRDADPWQRRVGAWVIGLLAPRGDRPGIAALAPLKQDPDWRVRYLAHIHHNALNDRPMRQGVPFILGLRAMLKDPIFMS